MTSADSGREKIAWTGSHMPMLRDIRGEFATTRPFEGLTIGICLHIEPKTAVLCSVLAASGATVAITGSPGTTQADVAAALAEAGHHVYHDETGGRRSHDDNIRRVLSHQPNSTTAPIWWWRGLRRRPRRSSWVGRRKRPPARIGCERSSLVASAFPSS